MTIAEPPAVAIEGVSHSYGTRQALDDVTFSITPSTFAVLLGLNGAGKSTLFSLIMRLYAVQRGRIRIFGRDVGHASSEALRMVGVVFQQRTLDLDLSVIQNLIYHAALHGIGKYDSCARADDVLARIALSNRANDKVRNLSGGQMRRVEIARASRRSVSTSNQGRIPSAMCVDWSSKTASRCSGPPISLTRSRTTTTSLCCTKGGFWCTAPFHASWKPRMPEISAPLSLG